MESDKKAIQKYLKNRYLKQNFDKYLKKEDYEKVHEKLIILTWKMANDIAQVLGKSYEGHYPSCIMQNLFKGMKDDLGFYKYFCCLTEWYEVIEISNYYMDGDSNVLYDYEKKTEYLIELYNEIIYSLENYCNVRLEYSDMEDDEILEKEMEKTIKLFKQMLTEIDEKYDENWTLENWLEVIRLRYMYFSKYFDVIEKSLLKSEDRDIIMVASEFDKAYDYLEKEYKNDVEFYKKYKLSDGKTYQDIYDQKTAEFEDLLKEMLKFVGVNTDGKDLSTLESCVMNYYPYYEQTLFHIDVSRGLVDYTYKDRIELLDSTYKNFSNNYKNHEENLKRYKESNELDDTEIDFIDDSDEI